jgi:hypothetical protein
LFGAIYSPLARLLDKGLVQACYSDPLRSLLLLRFPPPRQPPFHRLPEEDLPASSGCHFPAIGPSRSSDVGKVRPDGIIYSRDIHAGRVVKFEQEGPMGLEGYFRSTKGLRVLSTADEKGKVDSAVTFRVVSVLPLVGDGTGKN